MSEQAIETEEAEDFTLDASDEFFAGQGDQSEPEEIAEEAEVVEADSEVEIVLEGDEEPSSKPKRISGFEKRLKKMGAKIGAAKDEAEEYKRKLEAAEEEAKLWKMKATTAEPEGPPIAENFDTDEEFEAARREYDRAEFQRLAQEEARKIVAETESNTTQKAQIDTYHSSLRHVYEQADELNIKDFDQVEEEVTDIVGEDLIKYIVTYHEDKPAAMIKHLQANPGKAQEFAELARDPKGAIKLAQRLALLENRLVIRRNHSTTPDPDEGVPSGGGGGDKLPPGVKVW